jgi:hypothetical protein
MPLGDPGRLESKRLGQFYALDDLRWFAPPEKAIPIRVMLVLVPGVSGFTI